jgi:hypothetical protein
MGSSTLRVVLSTLPGAPVVAVTVAGCDWSECDTVQQLFESLDAGGISIPWHLPGQQLGEVRWLKHRPLAEVAARVTPARTSVMIPCFRLLDRIGHSV